MNKKSYMKIGILLMVGLFICAGCSAQQGEKYTVEDLDNLAEIKIYSAENNELIKTISDEEQLYQYNQCSLYDDSDTDVFLTSMSDVFRSGSSCILPASCAFYNTATAT